MSDDSLLARLAEEFTAEMRAGKRSDIEEYARRYPELAERVRELFPTLMMLERAAEGKDASPPPKTGLSAGTILGSYRILREVGRGGMGIVYEAVQVINQKRVALKVLPLQALVDSRRMERFFREARITADLKHPNIVPIFDAGQIAGTAYIAMQYIEGKSLDRILQVIQQPKPSRKSPANELVSQSSQDSPENMEASDADSPVSIIARRRRAGVPILFRDYLKWVVSLGIQAASGLAYAHSRGLIHRDIKPSNIIVDKKGTLWIADFGLARKMEDSTLTTTGVLLGTPRYMSPEQAEASIRQVDQRSDIYSLGATLYELVTCRPVFEGKTPQEILLKILARDPVAPRRLNHLIPADLEKIVMKAMSKRPEDRYQSADELAGDLQNWVRGRPVMAKGENPVRQSLRWFRRNLRFAAVVVPLILALIIVGDLYYREKVGDQSPNQAAGGSSNVEVQDSNAAEENNGEANPAGTASLLVPVSEDPTQNRDGKQILSDADNTDKPKQAVAEDTRNIQNSVPTPAEAAEEGSKVKAAAPNSAESDSGEANLADNVTSRTSGSKNTIQNNNNEAPIQRLNEAPHRIEAEAESGQQGIRLFPVPAQIAPPYTIRGEIRNSAGHLMPKASVCTRRVGAEPERERLCAAADQNGRFVISLNEEGRYLISPQDIPARADPSVFMATDQYPASMGERVMLNNANPSAFVDLRMPQRNGMLLITVVDSSSNLPIELVDVNVCRAELKLRCSGLMLRSDTGEYRIYTPSYPFDLRIRSSGYQEWIFFGDERSVVGPGSSRNLHIEMKPQSKDTGMVRNNGAGQVGPPLPAPVQLAPAKDAKLADSHHPVILKWREVEGAVSYAVEVDYCQIPLFMNECLLMVPLISPTGRGKLSRPGIAKDTAFTFNFIGAKAGRWRIWAIDKHGQKGFKSPWRMFYYGSSSLLGKWSNPLN